MLEEVFLFILQLQAGPGRKVSIPKVHINISHLGDTESLNVSGKYQKYKKKSNQRGSMLCSSPINEDGLLT